MMLRATAAARVAALADGRFGGGSVAAALWSRGLGRLPGGANAAEAQEEAEAAPSRPSFNERFSPLTAARSSPPPPRTDIDWSTLAFNDTHIGRTMFRSTLVAGQSLWEGSLAPYGPITLPPTAQVINYGQSIFEGLKAYRTKRGRIVLFRPEANAQRMFEGAGRMMMPTVPKDMFLKAVADTVVANADLVPPMGVGALYLRPLLMGTGSTLGVKPAQEYTFMVYCAAVGPYFKGGKMAPIHLKVAEGTHRAVRGGTGSTKCAGNYAPGMVFTEKAKAEGYADVVYLDSETGRNLEEVSACNVFSVKGNTIKTPALTGTILNGVTRNSIIQLAKLHGYDVQETSLSVDEAMDADEMFTTGTAVVVAPVGSLTYQGATKVFCDGRPGPAAQILYNTLMDIQNEVAPDPYRWIHPVL